MPICPFYTKDINDPSKTSGCIITCELNINYHCALRILAEKALLDVKKESTQGLQPTRL